jgi:hypothetical protein
MVFFKWLELWLGILGGLIGVMVLWKGRDYFRVNPTLPERGIFSMPPGNLISIFWAVLAAHAVCSIVIHQDGNERIFYGSLSLLFIAVALVMHFVAVKKRERASIG